MLNVLGKGQEDASYAFFKPEEVDGQTISGNAFHYGSTGVPILDITPVHIEFSLVTTAEEGHHSIFVGEVLGVGLSQEPQRSADEATLLLKDLGKKHSAEAERIINYDD